jgi:hypothetical protein
MTAWQRSNITERSEKGIGPISFRRLLVAGGAGAIVAMIGGRVIGFFPSCISAGVVLALVLAVTHPVDGMPLFVFVLRTLHGLATVAALHNRGGPLALVGQVMRVSPQTAVLLADRVYDAVWEDEAEENLLDDEWEYLGGFTDVKGQGLSAAENPFTKKHDSAREGAP